MSSLALRMSRLKKWNVSCEWLGSVKFNQRLLLSTAVNTSLTTGSAMFVDDTTVRPSELRETKIPRPTVDGTELKRTDGICSTGAQHLADRSVNSCRGFRLRPKSMRRLLVKTSASFITCWPVMDGRVGYGPMTGSKMLES